MQIENRQNLQGRPGWNKNRIFSKFDYLKDLHWHPTQQPDLQLRKWASFDSSTSSGKWSAQHLRSRLFLKRQNSASDIFAACSSGTVAVWLAVLLK
ncbi:hypothetical protein WJX82_004699 [Trebouxia sp. C0006]